MSLDFRHVSVDLRDISVDFKDISVDVRDISVNFGYISVDSRHISGNFRRSEQVNPVTTTCTTHTQISVFFCAQK